MPSHIARVDAPSDPATQTLYEDIVHNGFGGDAPINWFASQGARPDILRGTWDLTKALLVEGQLPGTLKQMILMAISAQNGCRYCEVTHSGALEQMGVPAEVITACVQDPDLADIPSLHRLVLKFALKAARDPNSIDSDDHAALRSAGLSEAEVVEVCMIAAFANFINTYADASGIDVD